MPNKLQSLLSSNPHAAVQAINTRRVQYTLEFKRVENIPRRDWRNYDIDTLRNQLHIALGLSTRTINLWDIQVASLYEIAVYGGLLSKAGVGDGKTLISLLAPQVIPCQRPVLLVPAALRDQTNQQVLPEMTQQFKLHPNLRVIGYSELSLAKNRELLNDIKPDLLLLDEAHSLRNSKSSRTRRVTRYLKHNQQTKVVCLSGTLADSALKDFAHLAMWALRERTPMPLVYTDLRDWSNALDETVDTSEVVDPGALSRFCAEGEPIKQGFRRRFNETPGVVASYGSNLGTSLVIHKIRDLAIPRDLMAHIETARNAGLDPSGEPVEDGLQLARLIKQLAMGFFYKWDPMPPEEWLKARREWVRYVADVIRCNDDWDSEKQVRDSAEEQLTSGALSAENPYHAWRVQKEVFKPNTKVVELSDYMRVYVDNWAKENDGIVWTSHPPFGKHYGEYYFGAGNNEIGTTTKTKILASIDAHGTGKNLQRFSKNLVLSPPASGKKWEQLLGRTHRAGQQADVVSVEILCHLRELDFSFEKARKNAKHVEETYSESRQKLNYASIM